MTKKRLLTLSVFLILFMILSSANAFALITRTYTFSGYTYVNGYPTGNVNVYLYAKFKKEVADGVYQKITIPHGCLSNSSGYYSVTFTMAPLWETDNVEMWLSMPPVPLSNDCNRHYYRYRYYAFGGGNNRRNIALVYFDYCEDVPPWEDELPEGMPYPWDYVYGKYFADAGTAGNWENRMFGRLQYPF